MFSSLIGLIVMYIRRGEEHSFILKPATSQWKSSIGNTQQGSRLSSFVAGNSSSAWRQSSFEGKHTGASADQYTVLVSCRCNYSGINYKFGYYLDSCSVFKLMFCPLTDFENPIF